MLPMKMTIGNYVVNLELTSNGIMGFIDFDERIVITSVGKTIDDLKTKLTILIRNFELKSKPHHLTDTTGCYSRNLHANNNLH